ncbi:hypothetical protein GIB67_033035 [Kingdonia uniflora]|uniref:Auxin efflux carrier component n=1 Tax=Kingdonia uniflora TaxID=39325 RepID=A0A7J7MYE3_9MAGN|nr:hypothetical protein GIB67_033035 [Kingdonia uniflora]
MIFWADIYHVLAATVPLYVALIIAYVSVKWWKLFTPDQCSGINKFVAKFSIPLLSFIIISANDPYKMNLKLIFSDSLQKLLAFFLLAVINKLCSRKNMDFIITGFSLSTLPNTLILGIPLMKGMYGDEAAILLAQIVVLQSTIWYNLLLILFEFRAAEATSVAPQSEDTEELEASMEAQQETGEENDKTRTSRKLKTKVILLTVGRKLLINPNTHATSVGLIWALVRFRWKLQLPIIVYKSITILSDGGLGMAMFSLGIFMASQTSLIPCGTRMAALAMGLRFLVGPALMAGASFTIGLRGKLLRIAIVQVRKFCYSCIAALPQGIVPFVFAKEYNIYPAILSTGVIFGMLITLPVALAYYLLLGL